MVTPASLLGDDCRDGADDAQDGAVWRVLEDVMDPEIPVLSIVDLGILRYARWSSDGRLHVGLTPTYSGCPATDVIRRSVREALEAEGYSDAALEEVLSPAWSSEWLTESGRRKLESFGIAPPSEAVFNPRHLLPSAALTAVAVKLSE